MRVRKWNRKVNLLPSHKDPADELTRVRRQFTDAVDKFEKNEERIEQPNDGMESENGRPALLKFVLISYSPKEAQFSTTLKF